MSDEKFEIAEYQNKAASMVIANQSDRIDALAIVAEAKRRAKVIADSFEVNVKTAHAAWKAAVAHRDGFLKPLADLETTIKQKVIAYDREHELLRQEEQRRLQAIADLADAVRNLMDATADEAMAEYDRRNNGVYHD
jgi:hypothetical protein